MLDIRHLSLALSKHDHATAQPKISSNDTHTRLLHVQLSVTLHYFKRNLNIFTPTD